MEGTLKEGLYQLDLAKVSSRIQASSPFLQAPCLFFNKTENESNTEHLSTCNHSNVSASAFLSKSVPSVSNSVSSVIKSVSESVSNCDHANKWHMRLGHPNFNVLRQVFKDVSVVPHISGNKIDFCAACRFGKMHQFNFPSSLSKTKRPFEIVHSDLWGPSPHVSTEGYKYYIHFVDDFTRFTWIFPLKVKSEAYSKVIQFQTFVERQFDHKIKCLQTN